MAVGRLMGKQESDMSCDDGGMSQGDETLPMTPESQSRADVEVFERFCTTQSTPRSMSCLEARPEPPLKSFEAADSPAL